MLKPVPREEDWALEIAEAAQAEFWCTIDVFVPATTRYDVDTKVIVVDIPETVLIAGRAARLQHLRSPLESFGAYERSVKRAVRFQIIPQANDPEFGSEASIRVTAATRNPRVTAYIYSVTSTAGSDHDTILTIEAESEFGVPA